MNRVQMIDELNDLQGAYDHLQVLATGADVDSKNVAAVLVVLNKQFESFLYALDKTETQLSLVK